MSNNISLAKNLVSFQLLEGWIVWVQLPTRKALVPGIIFLLFIDLNQSERSPQGWQFCPRKSLNKFSISTSVENSGLDFIKPSKGSVQLASFQSIPRVWKESFLCVHHIRETVSLLFFHILKKKKRIHCFDCGFSLKRLQELFLSQDCESSLLWISLYSTFLWSVT